MHVPVVQAQYFEHVRVCVPQLPHASLTISSGVHPPASSPAQSEYTLQWPVDAPASSARQTVDCLPHAPHPFGTIVSTFVHGSPVTGGGGPASTCASAL